MALLCVAAAVEMPCLGRTASCGNLAGIAPSQIGLGGPPSTRARSQHRRWNSTSSSPGGGGGLSPAQRRARRLKTRSFDCPRSFCTQSLNDNDEEESKEDEDELDRTQDVEGDEDDDDDDDDEGEGEEQEPGKIKNKADDENLQPRYELDPAVEMLLESSFRDMEHVRAEFDHSCGGDADSLHKRRRREHRRSRSIIFKSEQSTQLEKTMQAELYDYEDSGSDAGFDTGSDNAGADDAGADDSGLGFAGFEFDREFSFHPNQLDNTTTPPQKKKKDGQLPSILEED